MTACYENLSHNGIPVIIANPCKQEVKVKRTWIQRLFTLPFRPFEKYDITYELVEVLEDGQIFQTEKGYIVNAKTWHELRFKTKQEGKYD